MNKKTVLAALISVLLLSIYVPIASAHVVKRPDNIIVATIGEPESVDPAWACDPASTELIFNVYDTLIFFNVNRGPCGVPIEGKVDEFVPMLATEWTISNVTLGLWNTTVVDLDNPVCSDWTRGFDVYHCKEWVDNGDGELSVSDYLRMNNTNTNRAYWWHVDFLDFRYRTPLGLSRVVYYFKIRERVRFHNGALLTTEDVEYSFERVMVMDITGGPAWMLYDPLLNCQHANMSWPEHETCPINTAVESNATHVWFNLYKTYLPFLQTLCMPWSSIVNKEFCIAHECWPGTWYNWKDYHDNPDACLGEMCGTGPYKFDYWTPEVEWSIVRNVDYWGGWPAPGCGGGYPMGWIERATVKFVSEWATRKMMILAGDADIVHVPRCHYEEVEHVPGIHFVRNLPILAVDAMIFNYNISMTSPYLGPGFDPANPYVIEQDRIPINFFSDIDVRKGFAYSFDYDTYIADKFHNEGIQPATPVVKGLPCWNKTQQKYAFNLTAAVEHFKAAWGSEIWEKGFTMGIAYNTGNVIRQNVAEMLKATIESLNPLFHIYILEVDWRTYLAQFVNDELTLLIDYGVFANYPCAHARADCYDFLYPFMHSKGALNGGYINPDVDQLLEEGIGEMDEARRREISYELQAIYHNDCVSVPMDQPTGRHCERDWVQGWYYNPVYPIDRSIDRPGLYFYHLWKGYKGDCDRDYDVDLHDLYLVLIHYCESVPPAPPECDFDHDGHIDIDDLYWVLINYGC